MAKPISEIERLKAFNPNRIIVVYASVEKYDAVWKYNGSTPVQALKDLPQSRAKCDRIKDVISRFQIPTPGEDNIYELHEPNWSQIEQVRIRLRKSIKEKKHEKILIVYVIAGHGILYKGRTSLVINQFDS